MARRDPPLLETLPPETQAQLVLIVPLLFGAFCGFLLGESEAGWWGANVIAILGGVAGGYEHTGAGSGARRGVIGGGFFGLGIVVANAISEAAPLIEVPDPFVVFVVITALAGSGLGALGGSLRARVGTAV